MNDLRRMQLMLTEMLKVFHDFCIEHSLTYYALYGTALGAARHHGFIPWDDDLDVGMPRPDYERLIKIFNQENSNKRYILESSDSPDPYYLYSFSKIYDTQTTLIEATIYPIKRGIYIDIFPLDGCGSDMNQARRNDRAIKRMIILSNQRLFGINSQKKWYVNMLKIFFRLIPNAVLNGKKICASINKKSKKFDYESSDIIANLVGAQKRIFFPKLIYGVPILCNFENIQICCPEKIDAYLSLVYGDWRTPPPKESCVTHHKYYLDLSKPFTEDNCPNDK